MNETVLRKMSYIKHLFASKLKHSQIDIIVINIYF
jgi:hypothetical protein